MISRRNSSVAKEVSAEFYAYKRSLLRLADDLGKLEKHMMSIDAHWGEVARSQRNFAKDIASAYPQTDELSQRLQIAANSAHGLANDITSPKPAEHPTKLGSARVHKFRAEVDAVLRECKATETKFVESKYRDSKVDKIVRKGSKDNTKVERSMERRDSARADYDASVDHVVRKMKDLCKRSTEELNLAHKSFWWTQAGASAVVSSAAQAIHEDSKDPVLVASPVQAKRDALDDLEDLGAITVQEQPVAAAAGSASASPSEPVPNAPNPPQVPGSQPQAAAVATQTAAQEPQVPAAPPADAPQEADATPKKRGSLFGILG